MSIVTEDGTGKSDAESFITLAEASAYHADRGNAAWAALASDTLREQALRRATDYLEQVYGLKWKGERTKHTQALSWPRYDVCANGFDVDSDVVPVPVQRACAEMALKAAAGELAPDVGRLAKREKVDVLEVEYESGALPYVRYRAVDNLLAPYLEGGSGAVKVYRA
jgi:hypothetical protein